MASWACSLGRCLNLPTFQGSVSLSPTTEKILFPLERANLFFIFTEIKNKRDISNSHLKPIDHE
jgi:hypothetical protein